MRLVIVSEAMTIGGAETFVLRLAAALNFRGITVSLVILRGDLINRSLCQNIAPSVSVYGIYVPLLRWIIKVDGLFYRFNLNFSFLRWYQTRRLSDFLLKNSIDLLHSNLLTSDLVSSRACKIACIPWVTTMHGDYLAIERLGSSRAARIPDSRVAFEEVERTSGHFVSITEQQLSQMKRLMPEADACGRISKIYNGYSAPHTVQSNASLPDLLSSIPDGEFVIGMVARGIREKGWDVLLAAFNKLGLPSAWLVLVGDGAALQALRSEVSNPRVIFTGSVSDPLRYIARFDVGCLPSRFLSESLPTVIIEYMILGKPVIATDVAEIAKMIKSDSDKPAGILIPLDSVEKMAQHMHAALELLYRDSNERNRLAANASVAARKFDMDLCVDAYLAVYEKALLQ